MKILVVTQYFWPENFKINDLIKALVERGHEVTVYTGLPNYPDGKFFKNYSIRGPYKEEINGIKIIRSPLIPRGNSKGFRLICNYLSFSFFSTLLAPILVREKFDSIFIYQLSPVFSALPGIFLKFLKNAPVILWVNDLWPESLQATGVTQNKKILYVISLFVKFIYKYSDKIYITSNGFKNKIVKLGISENKIKFWPQWAESFFINSDNQIENTVSLPNGFIVMFAGNIGTAQDFETILEAGSILKNNLNIHFVILGDGLMKNWAENEVTKRQMQKNFHFLGKKPIESMPMYYSKASILLVTLKDTELYSITIPSKIQTYMASGKPILASLNGEGAEIIEKSKSGKVSKASDAIGLAENILIMSKLTAEELKAMGESAKSFYKENFDREKLITELINDLENLKKSHQ